jgi:hypothetical protein
MPLARYDIKGTAGGWTIHHDGDMSIAYTTREAAFEAAISQATNAVRMGHGVVVSIEEPNAESSVLGIG